MSQHENAQKSYQTALIDWLRFTCPWKFENQYSSELMKKLASLLFIDLKKISSSDRNSLGNLGYGSTLVFEEDLLIGVEAKSNIKIDGFADQFIVEISGQACRHFEQRGGDWVELLSFLDENQARFNRIDLALDDIDGSLDIKLLKQKIYEQRFSSSFRAVKANGKVGDEQYKLVMPDIDDLEDQDSSDPYIRDTRLGYTCTFGNRSLPLMLNIYDKLMERASKGFVAGVRNWIRFEVSITKNKVNPAVKKLVIPAMKEGSFGKLVAGIMRGLIEFKEGDSYERDSYRHINRLPIWRQYSKFLKGAEAIKLPSNQQKVEETVARSLQWANGYWSKALLKFFGTGETSFGDIVHGLIDKIRDGVIDWKMIAQIKNYLKQQGKDLTTHQIFENIQTYIDTFGSEAIDVEEVFKNQYQEKVEKLDERDAFFSDLYVGEEEDPKEEIVKSFTSSIPGIDNIDFSD